MGNKEIEIIYSGRIIVNYNERYVTTIDGSNIIFDTSELSKKIKEFGFEDLSEVEIKVKIKAR